MLTHCCTAEAKLTGIDKEDQQTLEWRALDHCILLKCPRFCVQIWQACSSLYSALQLCITGPNHDYSAQACVK